MPVNLKAGRSSCAWGLAGVLTTSPETVPASAISAGVWLYGGLKSTLNGGLTFVNQSLQAPNVTRGIPVGISP